MVDQDKSQKQDVKECGSCLYFRYRADAPGSCRRYPPRVVPVGGYCLTCWPHVDEHDTCGEFKSPPRPRKTAAARAAREEELVGAGEPVSLR